MMVEGMADTGQHRRMPGPPQRHLTEEEADLLLTAEARILLSRKEWAAWVRKLGISACARFYGITPAALSGRVRAIEKIEHVSGKP
jgi:hypothetical protein